MATVVKERTAERNHEVNISPRRESDGSWNVEAIDEDGSIEQAIFVGPNAENRARRYMAFEYRI